MYVFTSSISPRGPPWNEGHRPKVCHETSVLQVPAQEQHEHNFCSSFTNAFITYSLYTWYAGIAHHRALQTSGRGWADSKAVHGMECSGGALALLEIPLSRGCCLKCTVLPVQGGVLTHTTECLTSQRTINNKRDPRSCARVVYIAGDTLCHQPMGAGHMTVLQLRGPMAFHVLQWCHPMLASWHNEGKLLYPDHHLIWCTKVDSGPRKR